MTHKFVAKPIVVEAFRVGIDQTPLWFVSAKRKGQIQTSGNLIKGHIVAKTESGQINFYDPRTFGALFQTLEDAKDLDGNGTVDAREKAIASESTKKKAKRKPKAKKEEEVVVEQIQED